MNNAVPLIKVAEINPSLPRNLIPKPDDLVAFVPMAQIGEDGSISSTTTRPFLEVCKGYTQFCENDVLLAKITPCMENGKASLVKGLPSKVACGSTEFHVLRPREGTYPRYLFHAVWNQPFRNVAAKNMTGSAGQKRVPRSFLESYRIPLPPLAEQKRIASILDKADGIRRKLQQSLRLSDDFLRSVFLDMFGDPVTNPKGWPVHKSGDLFAEKPRLGTTRPATGTGYLVVRVGEIGNEQVDFSKCSRVEQTEDELKRCRLLKGDILIARAIGSRDQLGKCSFFAGHKEIVVGDSHVMRLRPNTNKCDAYWLYFLLSSPSGKALLQSKGGATAVQFNINGTQANDLDIPLPPLNLQSQFVNIANKARKEIERTSNMFADAVTLFSSLQQRAFRGEL